MRTGTSNRYNRPTKSTSFLKTNSHGALGWIAHALAFCGSVVLPSWL